MTEAMYALRKRALGVIVAGLGILPFAAAARADVVYDFSGSCFINCTGTATGVLDLTNAYVPGSAITAADFVSFTYAASGTDFTITAAEDPTFVGGLNANGSLSDGGLAIDAMGSGGDIFADVFGIFGTGGSLAATTMGFPGSFTPADPASGGDPAATPLPASLPLFATGIAALGLLGWRSRKRKAAFGSFAC